MPLTLQEQEVRSLLVEERLSFESHHVFELSSGERFSVDFLVFVGGGLVVERTSCSARKGFALNSLRCGSAYIDHRFRLLKAAYPRLSCGALTEGFAENQERLVRELKRILRSSDIVASSREDLRSSIRAMAGTRA